MMSAANFSENPATKLQKQNPRIVGRGGAVNSKNRFQTLDSSALTIRNERGKHVAGDQPGDEEQIDKYGEDRSGNRRQHNAHPVLSYRPPDGPPLPRTIFPRSSSSWFRSFPDGISEAGSSRRIYARANLDWNFTAGHFYAGALLCADELHIFLHGRHRHFLRLRCVRRRTDPQLVNRWSFFSG
jgi:hypothetical protein